MKDYEISERAAGIDADAHGNIMTVALPIFSFPACRPSLRLLFIGDIFGHAGRRIVADHVADIRSSQAIDVVIANCENSAAGFGVTPNVADELFRLGIDVMTSGNHIWDKRDIYDYLGRTPRLIRPANYPPGVPGFGVYIHTTPGGVRCAVMN